MMAFFDTGVVFARFDGSRPARQAVARRLWREMSAARAAVISSQVLVEFIDAARRHLRPRLSDPQLQIAVDSLVPVSKVDCNKGLVLAALGVALRHKLAIHDAMIVQAAIDAGASVLYSDQLPAGDQFGDVHVVDPFTQPDLGAQQPVAPYAAAAAKRRRSRTHDR